jgi:CBS domain protein
MERSYIGPAFEEAKVHDAMRVGVITCRPQTRLSDVAKMMVGYDAHSVVVADVDDGGLWGIVTSLDLPRHDPLRRFAPGGRQAHGRAPDLPPDRGAARGWPTGRRDLLARPRSGCGFRALLTPSVLST